VTSAAEAPAANALSDAKSSAEAAEAPNAPTEAPPPRPTFSKQVLRFTERFGHLMSRILLTLLYALLVAPAGIVMALFGDPLRIRRWRGTSWRPWTQDNDSLERARRQD